MKPEHRPTGRILLAFAIIYLVWGSTFLAIRISVHEIPPLILGAIRFLIAGVAVMGWTLIRGERQPSRREWLSASVLGFLIFVCDYGLLFWAEQRVPSGVAAVVMATIPVFIAICEIVLLRTQRLTVRLAAALLIGIVGVIALVSRSLNLGSAPIDKGGAVALVVASASWAVATVISRRLTLPKSKLVSSGAQMVTGGVLLTILAGAVGDFREFHPSRVSSGAWMATGYLIVFGSLIGFTAYVWLLHYESPTRVGTYAYVNPVVAVLVGYFAGGEPLGARTLIGSGCVLVSVIAITSERSAKPAIPAETVEKG